MIGLKIRYTRPTPKMIGRAVLDASAPRGGPSHVESRESLKYRQREAERARQIKQEELRYKQELRSWEAQQLANQHPWTHDSTVISLTFCVVAILMFFATLALSPPLLAGFFIWLFGTVLVSIIAGSIITS